MVRKHCIVFLLIVTLVCVSSASKLVSTEKTLTGKTYSKALPKRAMMSTTIHDTSSRRRRSIQEQGGTDVCADIIRPNWNMKKQGKSPCPTLVVWVPKKEGFTEFVEINDNNEVEGGFSIAIFCYALQLLPYNVRPIFKPFINEKGESNGTYDQLLRHIEGQTYEAVAGDVTIRGDRAQYVSFTIPYFSAEVYMLVRGSHDWTQTLWTFSKPFTTRVWVALVGSHLVTGAALSYLEIRGGNSEFEIPFCMKLVMIIWFPISAIFFHEVEALNVVMLEAKNKNIFKGIEVGKDKVYMSHLQFAIDALILGEWSLHNARVLTRIFTCFYLASGLKVNYNKSKIFGIGVSNLELNSIANSIGCQPSLLPCIYLGLPIGANMSRCESWNPVVDRFHKRLSMWKAKSLSFGGRLTLIKSVLGSLGVYYFSTFKAPIGTINKLESIRRKFYWGGNLENKISWIAWDKVIAPLKNGGLGIGSLLSCNQAMLSKWWWRFLNEGNAIWCKIIRSIHDIKGGFPNSSQHTLKSSPWCQIVKLGNDLTSHGIYLPLIFKRKIGNGRDTQFWLDTWIGNEPLKDSFPRLFRLESTPTAMVYARCPLDAPVLHVNDANSFQHNGSDFSRLLGPSDFGSSSSRNNNFLQPHGLEFQWSWYRTPRSPNELQELSGLVELVTHLKLTTDSDKWMCVISDSKEFSVKAMRIHISVNTSLLPTVPYRWNNILPSKVNISSWRIFHRRLPTRLNLDKRGIDLDSVLCPVCNDSLESEDHIFVDCCIAKSTWLAVLNWWGLYISNISSLDDAISLADQIQLPPNQIKFFDVVVQTTLWVLWRYRNETVFASTKPRKDMILNDIKLNSYTWIQSRAKKILS